MSRIGIVFFTAVLASSATWAQQSKPAEHRGSEQPRGVVTGGSAQTGISLHSDAAKVGGSVSAVSGGVSLNARDNLRGNTPPHNVKMVFSLNTGNYLSDVQVKVTDRSGKVVIDDLSNGPWLYAQLPAGSYKAAATYNGKTVTQNFSLGKSGVRTAHFRWPASVEQEGVGAAGTEAGGQILGTGPQEVR
jgi:hypothetical protein